MKAVQAVLFFVLALGIPSALATADADERAAMVAIRSHVPGLATSWSDSNLMQLCQTGSTLAHTTCTDGHVTRLYVTLLIQRSVSSFFEHSSTQWFSISKAIY